MIGCIGRYGAACSSTSVMSGITASGAELHFSDIVSFQITSFVKEEIGRGG